MRRIAYVLHQYPLASDASVHAELVALRELGADVAVVALAPGDRRHRFGPGPAGVPLPNRWDGEPDHLLPTLAEFDHLHTHHAGVGARALTPLAARVGRPWSVTCRGSDLFHADTRVHPGAWRELASAGATVVAGCRSHRDAVVGHGVDPARVRLIPHAARLAELLAEAPPPPTACRKLLAVRRPAGEDGLPTLVEAWRRARVRVPALELEIIGGEGLVDPAPAGLRLSPDRAPAETRRAIAAADLVVAPAQGARDARPDELTALLIEAGALRRPVIGPDLPGVSDLVLDGVNGFLVQPGDVDALADTLVRLADRPGELTRLGAAGPSSAAPHEARLVAGRLLREAFAA